MKERILVTTGKAMLIAAISAGVSGCSLIPGIAADTSGSNFPARPSLPPLDASELQCLSDDAYKRLLLRDQLRRQYAEQLEVFHERK